MNAHHPRPAAASAACGLALFAILVSAPASAARAQSPVAATIARTQLKVAKIYGAGGFRGMEAYQSGFLISPQGHVLTAWSYVLDTDDITVTLSDGRRFTAKLLGADPKLEIAVLKIDAEGLPAFDLKEAVDAPAGTRVLALSNMFGVATGDEPSSVQHGVVAVKTALEARRGTYETPYDGPVYVLDVVTNNPGAAGGALVTRRGGELVGMLGKELRNARNNTWLNYAMPIDQLRDSVDKILSGKFVAGEEPPEDKPQRSLTLARLGLGLVPDVVQRTPPFVDWVRPGSAAAEAGLRPDDLIVLLDGRLIQSCKSLVEELEYIDYEDPVHLSVLRDQELLEFTVQALGESGTP